MKLMNKAQDQVRRSEQNRLAAEGKKDLKAGDICCCGTVLPLNRPSKARTILSNRFWHTRRIISVYLLKEDLQQLWEQPT